MRDNQNILVIDDDDAHRLLIRRALKTLAAEISEARSVEQAISVLEENGRRLSLVVLDMNLAGVPSLSVLQHIRAKFSYDQLPVVVLSTSALEHDVVQAYAAGANCYLLKCVDQNEFRSILTRAVHFFFDKDYSV